MDAVWAPALLLSLRQLALPPGALWCPGDGIVQTRSLLQSCSLCPVWLLRKQKSCPF